MAIQTEPTRIQIPFADSGTKNTIPATQPTPTASQAASWTDGFPTQCSLPLASGGIPPARADFNGVFNIMTQSERFTQEGGVWAWDATVDYGTNRVVLGSDGLLYWSVAQSGPNVGGAQDPTADTTHTYWSTMPMLTPPLADDSNKVASTEWVRDLALAPVYVDATTGSDSNDGMSASTAMKTIGAAISKAQEFYGADGSDAYIKVAAGGYTEFVKVYKSRVLIELLGDVSITGDINCYENGRINVSGAYNLSVSGNVYADSFGNFIFKCLSLSITGGLLGGSSKSSIYIGCPTQITATTAVAVTHGASIRIENTLDIICSGDNHAIFAHTGSLLSVGATTITANSKTNYAVHVGDGSIIIFSSFSLSGSGCAGGLGVSGSGILNIGGATNIDNMITSREAINIGNGSYAFFGGAVNIHGSPSSQSVVSYNGSVANFNSNLTVTHHASGKGVVEAFDSGFIYVRGVLTIDATSGATRLLYVDFSRITINSFTVSGSVSQATVMAVRNSSFVILLSATVSGTLTGKRYTCNTGSQIFVDGAGANRIPGSSAGTADASQFAYYG